MEVRARLIETRVPSRPSGAVLVMHGGGSRKGEVMVSPTQLSVLRMLPIAKRIALAGRGDLAVFRLLNSTRGWDTHHTPVDDALWALARVGERLGHDVPVALVGHSLGGRAAILAGSHPAVTGVVALNPFVYPQDGRSDLAGRRVLVAHGTRDRIAPLSRAEAVARMLSRSASVEFVRVNGGKHAMLSRHRTFDGLASDFVRDLHLGSASPAPVGGLPAEDLWREV